jgi:3-hydroxyisobutyrate dehydrogenase-like beta-hydroxyacid dehydrogenase
MAGARKKAFDRVRPVLELLSLTIYHSGPGGQAVKGVNQPLAAISTAAVARAFTQPENRGGRRGFDSLPK